MNYHYGNLMLKYFSQTLQISHKTQGYILDGYISHLYKWMVQTEFQYFQTTIEIVSGSPDIVSNGPKLISFMQLV